MTRGLVELGDEIGAGLGEEAVVEGLVLEGSRPVQKIAPGDFADRQRAGDDAALEQGLFVGCRLVAVDPVVHLERQEARQSQLDHVHPDVRANGIDVVTRFVERHIGVAELRRVVDVDPKLIAAHRAAPVIVAYVKSAH